jgi:hypothetical protein
MGEVINLFSNSADILRNTNRMSDDQWLACLVITLLKFSEQELELVDLSPDHILFNALEETLFVEVISKKKIMLTIMTKNFFSFAFESDMIGFEVLYEAVSEFINEQSKKMMHEARKNFLAKILKK